MKFFLFSLILSSNLFATETMTVRADIWCPYNCDAKDKSNPGILVELMQIAFEKNGYKIDYSTMPWPQALADVRSGRFNSTIGITGPDAFGMAHTEKPQMISITCAYALTTSKKVVNKAQDLLKLNSLGVVKDYVYGEQTDKTFKSEKFKDKVFAVATDDALKINIRRILDGKLEALIEDRYVMANVMKKLNLTKIKSIGCTEDKAPIWIGFTEKNPKAIEWVNILKKTEEELDKSGKLTELFKKYNATR